MSILPHSSAIREDAEQYVNDAADLAKEAAERLRNSDSFRAIYRVTLATDTVLADLSDYELPTLSSGRGLVQRIPLLVAWGQIAAAKIELRRFIEVSAWTLYFTDHKREWQQLERDPSRGFEREPNRPISHAAHREVAHYLNYAKELFEAEPSGLSASAVGDLKVQYGNLSSVVHPGEAAVGNGTVPKIDQLSPAVLAKFVELQRIVCSSVVILEAALLVDRFDKLQAMGRAWFDWLVGSGRSRKIRSGPFGLPS